MQFFVRNGNPKARTEHAQFFVVQLFLLVGNVLAFTGFTQTVAFDCLGENDRRSAFVIEGGAIGCVHFNRIVPAQPHPRKLVVGKMLNHLEQTRIGAEQVLPEVSPALHEKFLILPVSDFTQTAHQNSIAVIGDQAVPIAAPDALNDVPPGAAKDGFQFLNNFPVATHRPIQAL